MDLPIHVLNGLLRQAYFLGDHWTVLLCGACGALHVYATEPAGKSTFVGFVLLTAGAAGVATGVDSTALRPLPYILAGLSVLVVAFVARDRHAPEMLRHRAAGGLAVYAGAILLFAGFDFMMRHMEAAAFAESFAGRGDSGAMVQAGRNTLRTVVAWFMWIMGPAGIAVMLGQGAVTHRQQSLAPADRMEQIRRPRPLAQYPDAPPPRPVLGTLLGGRPRGRYPPHGVPPADVPPPG